MKNNDALKNPKAILFDLDDTLISFSHAVEKSWQKVCDEFVTDQKTDFNAGLLLEKINKTRNWFWSDPERHKIGRMDMTNARREIVKKALLELKYFDIDRSNAVADAYSRMQNESICLFPDTKETLDKIMNLGIRMALVTNGTSVAQRSKIDRFGLAKYFDYVFIEGETGFGKPDVNTFNNALEKMMLYPDDVWMVGDNLSWDVECPQKIGIFSVWNDWNKKGLPEGSFVIPDLIINTIGELPV
jgi:putative hydrolase of the HAD superfamily